MNHKRLSLLARVLDRVPREHFDLDSWSNNVPQRLTKKSQLTACGTTACACGWALTVPSFKRAGLVAEPTSGDGNWEPRFRLHDGYDAICKFFGVDLALFKYLFINISYRESDRTNPRAVARRIGELLKRDRKERGK